MSGFVGIYLGIVKHTLFAVLTVAFFAQFGPDIIAIPGAPHVRIRDIKPELRSSPAPPLEGVFARNDALQHATVLFNNTLRSSGRSHTRAPRPRSPARTRIATLIGARGAPRSPCRSWSAALTRVWAAHLLRRVGAAAPGRQPAAA